MECQGITGRLFGHSYEAVFDEVPPHDIGEQVAKIGLVPPWRLKEVVQSITKFVYQGHVCTRCGNRVRRIERI